MIVDRVKIYIKAGNGGNGAVSFRREKYVNAGGPDGGDGGDGGNIVFAAKTDMRTLMDFRYARKYVAESGEPGRKRNCKGRTGEDLIINVPPGTVVIDAETGRVAADIREGSRVLLKGGKGGKGNARFATPTRQAPRFSTPGRKTEQKEVILELRSIADVGFVGFPNVGKSTLLSMVTAAKPKIADYHFTTLKPNLGMAAVGDFSFILADIPGLIEGASAGAGLGHDFLRHIERTRMLVHVIDVSGCEGRDPVEDYRAIRKELEEYSEELITRPEIIAANKMDIPGAEENLERLRKELGEDTEIIEISAATGAGTKQLMIAVANVLKELPPAEPIYEEGVIEEWEMPAEISYDLSRGEDGIAEVNGNAIDAIFARIDPNDPMSMRHFEKLLNDYGIIRALREFGVQDGEEVRLNGETFDFVE